MFSDQALSHYFEEVTANERVPFLYRECTARGSHMTQWVMALVNSCSLLAICTTGEGQAGRPLALSRLADSRGELKTAWIAWSLQKGDKDGRWIHYTSRFAGGAQMTMNRGDEDGVVTFSESGTPNMRQTAFLYDSTGLWKRDEGSTHVELRSDQPYFFRSIEALGLYFSHSMRSAPETIWSDAAEMPSPRRYREAREGNLHVVSAGTDDGTITWWIDPQRGWGATRVTLERDGVIEYETRTELDQFDGHWFPRTVRFYRRGYDNGQTPYEIVRVDHAQFNRPDHPPVVTLKEIGVDAGFSVVKHGPTGQPQEMKTLYWDGRSLISSEEFQRRVKAGEFEFGPLYQAAMAAIEAGQVPGTQIVRKDPAGRAATSPASGPLAGPGESTEFPTLHAAVESEWLRYTRRFIIRYRLTDEQKQQAMSVLVRARERAAQHLARNREQYEQFERDCREVLNFTGDELKRRRGKLDERRAALKRPFDEIFERDLKPGLEKIPTRDQRRAALSAEAEKPARP